MQSAREFLRKKTLGDLPLAWRLCYACFSLAATCILASHTVLSPVKMSVFFDACGKMEAPMTRTMQPLILLPIILLYNVLISLVSPSKLIGAVSLMYGALFTYLASVLYRGVDKDECMYAKLLWYSTESKGLIFPVMLWSVLTHTASLHSKQAFPVISFAMQIGLLLGNLAATGVRHLGGTPGVLILQAVAAIIVGMLGLCGCHYAKVAANATHDVGLENGLELAVVGSRVNDNLSEGSGRSADPPHQSLCSVVATQLYSSVEGLFLLGRPYVAMTFWVSCAHLAPRVILDFQSTVMVTETFETSEEQVSFWGKAGLVSGCINAAFSLLGSSWVVERYGLRLALLVFPFGMLLAVLGVCSLHGDRNNLWPVMFVSMFIAMLEFGLNGPCRELLYVRTSKDIKFKAKSWADMYGNILFKVIGSQINHHVNRYGFDAGFTGSFSLLWCGFWALLVTLVGAEHARLEREDQFVT